MNQVNDNTTDITSAGRRAVCPRRLATGLLLAGCLFALAVAPAAAATRIGTLGSGPGGFAQAQAVAVSAAEAGDIYVTDGAANNRVDQFTPSGAFVRAFGWGIVPGAASGTGNLTIGSTTITGATTSSGEFMPGQILTGPGIPSGDAITRVGQGTIQLAKPPTASAAAAELKVVAGPGNVPTNEVQKLTVKATAGTFKLTFQSPYPDSTTATTSAIVFDAPASGAGSVQEALAALSNIGPGNVSVSGGPGDGAGTSPYLIEFKGRYTDSNVRPLRVEASLSGGPAEAALATPTEGGGAVETCTTACTGEIREQPLPNGIENTPPTGAPGQMNYADEIAVDNSCSEQTPPKTGAECEAFDPAYGDVYVIDQRDYRVERYSPEGHLELMIGGGVDQGPHHPGNLCTAAYIAAGDTCGVGSPGTGPAHFYREEPPTGDGGEFPVSNWQEGNNSIAVGPDGTVYVGDFGRIQEFNPEGEFAGQFVLPGETSATGAGDLTEGSATVTAVTTTSGAFAVGQPIQGDRHGIPNNTYIVAVGAGTLTLSKPAGEDATEFELSVGPQFVRALAIDPSGNIYERSESEHLQGGISTTSLPGIREYGPGPLHSFIRTFDAEEPTTEPTHIALDTQGDLFASDFDGTFIRPSCAGQQDETCPESPLRAFRPGGSLYSVFTSPEVISGFPGDNPRGLAFGPLTGKLYAVVVRVGFQYVAVLTPPVPGPPVVKEGSEEAGDLEPTTAVLHAVVNPQGTDTKYQVEYVTQAHFAAEGFANPEKTPLKDLGAVAQDDPVSVPLSGLRPATTYHWRVVASSECEPGAHPHEESCKAEGERNEAGEEIPQAFSTLPAVSVRGFTTQTVGPELITLEAELNPNNGVGTEYTFRYGETESYGGGSSRGTLPLGGEFKPVRATFTGLKPDTTYHYQLTVRNANGEEHSADQTFTTELSSAEELTAEDCSNGSRNGESNSTIREEDNSLALPDCRAYEQVSEVAKEGSQATNVALSPSGERAYYASEGVFAGAKQNLLSIQYIAHRTPSGWVTQPVVGRLAPPPTEPIGNDLFSPELDRWLFTEGTAYSSEEDFKQTSGYFSMGLGDGSFILHASPVLAPLEGAPRQDLEFMGVPTSGGGTSADLSRLYITTRSRLLAEDPRPDHNQSEGEPSEDDRIYEVGGVGGASPSLRLAAEVPTGLSAPGFLGTTGCAISPAGTLSGRSVPPRLTDETGATIFYTAPIENAAGYPCGEGTPNPYGLFARTGQAAPIQLNTPPPTRCAAPHPCAGAEPRTPFYQAAAANGRYVWFTTEQPLLNADADTTNDLYVAKLTESGELEELVQASAGDATKTHPNPGVGADVGQDGVSISTGTLANNDGVLAVSADGTHAAFESPAVLTEEPNALGQSAAPRANNLYVYDLTTAKTRFVTELCSGPEQSGSEPGPGPEPTHNVNKAQSVYDPACPASLSSLDDPFLPQGDFKLWDHGGGGEVQFTPDGNFFLFASRGRFTPGDTGEQQSVFRYDFETGQLIRVSIGRRGNAADGNGYPAAFAGVDDIAHGDPDPASEDGGRAISEDGAVVIFKTSAPLVSHDTNERSDVYEWEEQGHGTCTEVGGCVSLISSGHAPEGDGEAVISSSGRDILFRTSRGLVPGDTDGVADIYDARVEGGFHPATPPPVCTSPEACGEATTSPPPAPVIGTPGFVGPGNAATHLRCGKGRHRVLRHGQPRCVATGHQKHHSRSHRKSSGNPKKSHRKSGDREGHARSGK